MIWLGIDIIFFGVEPRWASNNLPIRDVVCPHDQAPQAGVSRCESGPVGCESDVRPSTIKFAWPNRGHLKGRTWIRSSALGEDASYCWKSNRYRVKCSPHGNPS